MKEKKSPKRKNVSQTVPNGTLLISNDRYFFETDGKSDKIRMAGVIDSNRQNELAIVKYTKSKKHGREFENEKGIKGHSDTIYTKDDEGNPITVDNKKFVKGPNRRKISENQANEIKRRNVKESRYRNTNVKKLREMKKR